MDSFSHEKRKAESVLCDAAEIQRLKRFAIWETSYTKFAEKSATSADQDSTEQTIQSRMPTEDYDHQQKSAISSSQSHILSLSNS